MFLMGSKKENMTQHKIQVILPAEVEFHVLDDFSLGFTLNEDDPSLEFTLIRIAALNQDIHPEILPGQCSAELQFLVGMEGKIHKAVISCHSIIDHAGSHQHNVASNLKYGLQKSPKTKIYWEHCPAFDEIDWDFFMKKVGGAISEEPPEWLDINWRG